MTVTLEALYSSKILSLAASITRNRLPDDADVVVSRRSAVCGSGIRVGLCFDHERQIADYGHEVQACALGQASAAIVASHCIGLTAAALADAMAQMEAILRGEVPEELLWPDMAVLAPVRDFPPRHDAVLLPYRALTDAFMQ
ncbi:MAG TPA: iron-sulfur cluster assembly scaffold protein [Rhodospirillaceae bacterium]|nr:iron-sulfur cluster assembly scaffold protein [Alphaproteobacteria bacterium]OUT41166.1 MAG: hypothetical protein CBB62_02050 [Micavibrio sp. TMED2]HCI45727.1 iron-sulfur cluster assembly scaffold protein [Rhodospirillaceae bacterium]MAS47324.1 iron-sulfur cluster assembly scaffold protein [Alphaproteobacteria bacterium]MAX95417.1 iron-sulfur cluster assembly scaffold protein [Alphaproteobacteria bacterium]|tara:strand:- start:2470 stop:2895 length:426 start_codon:yes stop_codon:yes gene_type:complete